MNTQTAVAQWRRDRSMLEQYGIHLPDVVGYMTDDMRRDYTIALDALPAQYRMGMDAQPALSTDPNAGIPALLTTWIDPTIIRVMFAPLNATQVYDEVQRGTWTDDTALFPVVEESGEVTSYGDYAEGNTTQVNMNWPARQVYRFQIIKRYGDLELKRAGLGRINYVAEMDRAAIDLLLRFSNYAYIFGIQGLQNYGIANDPNLPAAITPTTKAEAGLGTQWISTTGLIASPNEILQDVQYMFSQLVSQTAGLVDAKTPMVLVLSPATSVALTATNSFNVNMGDLLKKNFPNLRFVVVPQFGVMGATNPEGIAAGNMAQLIAEEVSGQRTGQTAYNTKVMSFPIILEMSAYKQKVASGIWGTILRIAANVVTMIGI